MNVVQIEAAESGEFAEQIAAIHSSAYSHGHFTSTFELSKLTEYNQRLIENSDISLAAVEDGRVLGFIIAGEQVSRGVGAFIRQNRLFLVRKLLMRPNFLLSKFYGKVRSLVAPHPPSIAAYRLLSIATAPGAQSKGVGGELLTALENRLREKGLQRYGLSVMSKNTRAIEFYRRNGFIQETNPWGAVYFYKDL